MLYLKRCGLNYFILFVLGECDNSVVLIDFLFYFDFIIWLVLRVGLGMFTYLCWRGCWSLLFWLWMLND